MLLCKPWLRGRRLFLTRVAPGGRRMEAWHSHLLVVDVGIDFIAVLHAIACQLPLSNPTRLMRPWFRATPTTQMATGSLQRRSRDDHGGPFSRGVPPDDGLHTTPAGAARRSSGLRAALWCHCRVDRRRYYCLRKQANSDATSVHAAVLVLVPPPTRGYTFAPNGRSLRAAAFGPPILPRLRSVRLLGALRLIWPRLRRPFLT